MRALSRDPVPLRAGTVSLWRYLDNARNYPGWHLTADAAGCAALLALLDALGAEGAGAARTLALTAPGAAQRAVPNNRAARWEAATTLRLTVDAAADAWHWEGDGAHVLLRCGRTGLAGVRQGVADIAAGRGDHACGRGAQALWFWWWPRG